MFHHLKATPITKEQTTSQPRLRDEITRGWIEHSLPRRPTNRRRGGSVVVIAALSLVALTGMSALAVDYGMMVSDANRLQRACDASALAGATYLKSTGNDQVDVANARLAAAAMMTQHKITGFDSNTITFNATWSRITVPANATRNFFFAGVFKTIAPNSPSSGTVSRRASAGRTALSGVPAVAPIAITVDDYNRYKNGTSFENKLVDNNRQNFDDGDIVAMDLRLDNSGKSGAKFQDDLADGTPGTTTIIGQPVNNALNASLNSQSGKMENAIEDRFDRAKNAPWNDDGNGYTYPNYPLDNPRVITIMVANPNPQDNSNPMITALFFVTVYIEDFKAPGKDNARMRMRILPASTYGSDRSDIIVGSSTTAITGPSVVGLTE